MKLGQLSCTYWNRLRDCLPLGDDCLDDGRLCARQSIAHSHHKGTCSSPEASLGRKKGDPACTNVIFDSKRLCLYTGN